jgi:hypothetical protein
MVERVEAPPTGNIDNGVSEDVLSVVAECERLFASGETDTARQRLLSLQLVTPVSEEEWKACTRFALS